MKHLFPIMFGLTLGACVNGKLLPSAAVAIEGAELVACDALIPLALPGVVGAEACAGSEVALAASLRGVTAAPVVDGGTSTGEAAQALTTGKRAVYTHHRGRRVCAGFVPPHLADGAQARLDAGGGS